MKHGHLMQRLEIFVQFLSLRSTQVTILRNTRETGDIHAINFDTQVYYYHSNTELFWYLLVHEINNKIKKKKQVS